VSGPLVPDGTMIERAALLDFISAVTKSTKHTSSLSLPTLHILPDDDSGRRVGPCVRRLHLLQQLLASCHVLVTFQDEIPS
jgi:hypothetical protein